MKMSPITIVAGSLLILAVIVGVVVVLPYIHTSKTGPSDIFRGRTSVEATGRDIVVQPAYVFNRTGFVRCGGFCLPVPLAFHPQVGLFHP